MAASSAWTFASNPVSLQRAKHRRKVEPLA
jgi:hypothetical protein